MHPRLVLETEVVVLVGFGHLEVHVHTGHHHEQEEFAAHVGRVGLDQTRPRVTGGIDQCLTGAQQREIAYPVDGYGALVDQADHAALVGPGDGHDGALGVQGAVRRACVAPMAGYSGRN